MKKCVLFVLFWLFLAVISGPPGLSAQDRSSITGLVKSTAGAPIAGVSVRISGDLLPGGRTFTTGKDGQFRFPGIPPGTSS